MPNISARLHPHLAEGKHADWLLLLVPGTIWGASFLFIAQGLSSVGPNGVAFLRILIGFALLSLFHGARKPVPLHAWLGIAGLGVLWLAFPLSLFPLAEQRVSSALTGMLNGANPLFTALVAAAIARRIPSRSVMTGIGVGMAGTILMGIPALSEGHSSATGVGLIIAALVSYGFALNIAKPLQQRNGALPIIWRAQMIALVLTAPLGLPEMFAAHWRPGAVLALIALGALGTGVAHVVMSVAAGKLGAVRASATTFLIPGVALVLGVVFRGERISLLSIAGSAVSIGGAWLLRRAQKSGEEGRANRMERRRSVPPQLAPMSFQECK
jgi:drug/metabolite transporter (DMT)-like permease